MSVPGLLIPAIPVALTAVSWLASGVFLGDLFPFPAGWLAFALGSALACASARPAGDAIAAASGIPVAAVWWYLSAHGGRHAGPVAFRAAVRRGQR
jgi:hypothetical protein